ncbi:MAG: hypothetical protein CBB71_19015 [Rhodopirellula sp. TMED11]|nr:MAG: hypothetical protein CBB71_19015 [Rhodopirellula sp. TMED11]
MNPKQVEKHVVVRRQQSEPSTQGMKTAGQSHAEANTTSKEARDLRWQCRSRPRNAIAMPWLDARQPMLTMPRCTRVANLIHVALPLQRFAFAIPMCLGQQYNMFCLPA